MPLWTHLPRLVHGADEGRVVRPRQASYRVNEANTKIGYFLFSLRCRVYPENFKLGEEILSCPESTEILASWAKSKLQIT